MDDSISRQVVKEQMLRYGFTAPDMTVTEFIEDLPSAQPETQWTPCSERLPKEGHYLVQDVIGVREVGLYTKYGWIVEDHMGKIVAWMPLPTPYREENDDERIL